MRPEEIIRIHKEAPGFVRQYELRQLTLYSQVLLLPSKKDCCIDEHDLLAKWINTNQEWIAGNKDKYEYCKRFAMLTLEDLINLYATKQTPT
jgi:hypothetical protein